ncbi:hypothetical protein Trydic_g13086 [Trypoxylus dichotomus]
MIPEERDDHLDDRAQTSKTFSIHRDETNQLLRSSGYQRIRALRSRLDLHRHIWPKSRSSSAHATLGSTTGECKRLHLPGHTKNCISQQFIIVANVEVQDKDFKHLT